MDLTSLPPELLGIGSGWAFTGLAVYGVLSGRLVPKPSVDRMVDEYEKRLEDARHDAMEWRAEGRIKDQQNAELTDSLRTLGSELAPLVETTMRTIQKRSNQKRPGRSGPEESP